MIERVDYQQVNAEAINGFAALKKHTSCIDSKLTALVELRVSQINGCVFCLDLHARQARALGESQQRLDCIAAWDECQFFDEKEKAALAWTDALTHISQTHAPDHLYQALEQHFSSEEIVDLTLIIAFMNTWNRLAISFRQSPEAAS